MALDDSSTRVCSNRAKGRRRVQYDSRVCVAEVLVEAAVVHFAFEHPNCRENALQFVLLVEVDPTKVRPLALAQRDKEGVFVHSPSSNQPLWVALLRRTHSIRDLSGASLYHWGECNFQPSCRVESGGKKAMNSEHNAWRVSPAL